MKKNTNCLAGMRCPKCKALEPFSISVFCRLKLYDDGTSSPEDTEWTDDSECECLSCWYYGTVRDFLTDER